MDRRDFLKASGGTVLLGASGAFAFSLLTDSGEPPPPSGKKWGMVIDLGKCQEYSNQRKEETGKDCTDCLDACRVENNVALPSDARDREPLLDNRWIRKVTIRKKPEEEAGGENKTGEVADLPTKPVILLCNHCDKPPCAQVCPVQATFKRDDGIVIVDHHRCIGCRYCMIACPYNARQFSFKENKDWPTKHRPKRSHGVAESCTLCAHRLDTVDQYGNHGIPACMEACKAGALTVGDMNDETSLISELLAKHAVKRLKEDLGTEPKVHYIGL